jgi:precorrin-2 dehydrogenase/sirohydrochlorin ferrochelatase
MPQSFPQDFPVCLRLEGVPVLLVGAGRIAEERAHALLAAGARLKVVAPEASAGLTRLALEGRLELHTRAWVAADVAGHALVFGATDDVEVSRALWREVRARGGLLNAADEPELCDFTLPSVGRRGPLTVAVSSGGLAPALAARLRRRFEAQLGLRHVQLARLSGWLRARLPRGAARQQLLKGLAATEAATEATTGAAMGAGPGGAAGAAGQEARGLRRAAWAHVRAARGARGGTA